MTIGIITDEMVEKVLDRWYGDLAWRDETLRHGIPHRVQMRAALEAVADDIAKAEREACIAAVNVARADKRVAFSPRKNPVE